MRTTEYDIICTSRIFQLPHTPATGTRTTRLAATAETAKTIHPVAPHSSKSAHCTEAARKWAFEYRQACS